MEGMLFGYDESLDPSVGVTTSLDRSRSGSVSADEAEKGLQKIEKRRRKEERKAKKQARAARKKERSEKGGEKDKKLERAPIETAPKQLSVTKSPTTSTPASTSAPPPDDIISRIRRLEKKATGAEASTPIAGPSPLAPSASEPSLPEKMKKAKKRPADETMNPTVKEKKTRSEIPRKETKAPSTPAAPSTPKTTPKSEDEYAGLTTDELRLKLSSQTAMYAYLSSKWISIRELSRLEKAGVLHYKRGKWSSEEEFNVMNHLELFKKINRMDDSELSSVIFAKGRGSTRSQFSKFWPELAAEVPGRPVQYVCRHVKEMYDTRRAKGKWTAEEDTDLLRALDIHGPAWEKIGVVVDRPAMDCRNRYRDQLKDRSTHKKGRWTVEEEEQLISTIQETNLSLKQDANSYEVPWDIIGTKMQGTRTRSQLRKKWQSELRQKVMSGQSLGFGRPEYLALVIKLRASGISHETDINWREVWPGRNVESLKGGWRRIKKIAGVSEATILSDVLQMAEDKLRAGNRKAVLPHKIVSAEFVKDSDSSSSDGEEEKEGEKEAISRSPEQEP
ncbi:hypothetical protein P7C73_g1816, partial [Tremellales sp. Uapishka_1]